MITDTQRAAAIARESEPFRIGIHSGPSCLCNECCFSFDTDQQEEMLDEGSFDWSPCELCGTTLGGDRWAAHGVTEDDDVIHFDICTDCLSHIN
jgi:hypothetical protein